MKKSTILEVGEKWIDRSDGGWWLGVVIPTWNSPFQVSEVSLFSAHPAPISLSDLYHFNLILLQRKACLTFMVIGWSAGVFGRKTHIFVNLDIYRDISLQFGELENVKAQGCRWEQWSLHLQHQQLRGKTDMGVWSWLWNSRRASCGRSSSWELQEKPISG